MRAVGVSMARALAAPAVVAVLSLCPASAQAEAAAGLEPGVHVSQGSPAAHEYALPLNQARHTSAPSSHESGPETALFGAGIKPSGGTGSGGSGAASGTRRSGSRAGAPSSAGTRHAGTSAGATGNAQARLPAAVLRADRAGASHDDGSLLALLGGGVAILVLGGFGGTVLRHSRRPTTPA